MLKNQNKTYLGAKRVLHHNFRGTHTVPSTELYPHQWLWDSCFIAIGLRHYDTQRAKNELISLKGGQWKNGMLPNIIFHSEGLNFDDELWDSQLNRYAPKDIKTSGITHPPMLAEAVHKVGLKLNDAERQEFYREMIDSIVRYHHWLYEERDPHDTGLVSLIHPYESGLDNSPVWAMAVRRIRFPWWTRLIMLKNFKKFFNYLRRDTRSIEEDQRISFADAVEYFYILNKLKKYKYDSKKIISKSRPVLEDLSYNSIFIRANRKLRQIAEEIDYQLPEILLHKMKKAEHSIEKLQDKKTGLYHSRYLKSKKLIKQPTVASLLPLYAGHITHDKARELVAQLQDKDSFNLHFPVPSVPFNSKYFKPENYWQGPSWVNTNWLIIEGLMDYGFKDEAHALKHRTIKMVEESGFFEYFSPLDGSGKGARNFSWTAALAIDLIES